MIIRGGSHQSPIYQISVGGCSVHLRVLGRVEISTWLAWYSGLRALHLFFLSVDSPAQYLDTGIYYNQRRTTVSRHNKRIEMPRAASRCELILEPDWLPCRSQSIGATEYLKSRYIEFHEDCDWFLALATAMKDYDSLQSRALIMFYIFV